MEKLPVLNLEYTFDLLWDIKDTDGLKNAWNGCHCLNINIRDDYFLELIETNNLKPYLDEADSESVEKCVTAENIFTVRNNLEMYIEKAKRYDLIKRIIDTYTDYDAAYKETETIIETPLE